MKLFSTSVKIAAGMMAAALPILGMAQDIPTTFNVDMSCSPVSFSTVHITGPWCGWCAAESYNTLSDDDGDGIYSIVVNLPAGQVEYKYMVDSWAHQENLVDDMVAGASCAPITDYNGYANRLMDVGSTANDTYDTCGTCDDYASTTQTEVSFAIDMSQTGLPNADYTSIVINGNWNGWAGWGVELTDADGDGIFSGTAGFDAGSTVEFVIAGTGPADGYSGWGSIIYAAPACSNDPAAAPGSNLNYIFTVGDEPMTIAYCAGTCDETCFVAVPGCTDEAACNYDAAANTDDGSCIAADAGVLCGAGSVWNAETCSCEGDFEMACGEGTVWDAASGTCVAAATAEGGCAADINSDGMVTASDLLVFLTQFGNECD
jgi:hypothetical protein